MQQPDTGKALIPWTLETMAIPQLLCVSAAKQFRRPLQVRVPCPHLCRRLRRVLHNACLTAVSHHLLCIWEALLAHPWLACSTYIAQQGGPRASEEWPCHQSARGSQRGGEETYTKRRHCLSAVLPSCEGQGSKQLFPWCWLPNSLRRGI